LDCIGTRELLQHQVLSDAPPPGKYRPKWEKMKPKNRTIVEWHHDIENIAEPKSNYKYKPIKKPFGNKTDRNYSFSEKFSKSHQNFVKVDDSSMSTNRSKKMYQKMDFYANKTETDKFYPGFVDLKRQMSRDRHDYIELANNKPHDKRFFVIPDKKPVQKKNYQKYYNAKTIETRFRLFEIQSKNCKLRLRP